MTVNTENLPLVTKIRITNTYKATKDLAMGVNTLCRRYNLTELQIARIVDEITQNLRTDNNNIVAKYVIAHKLARLSYTVDYKWNSIGAFKSIESAKLALSVFKTKLEEVKTKHIKALLDYFKSVNGIVFFSVGEGSDTYGLYDEAIKMTVIEDGIGYTFEIEKKHNVLLAQLDRVIPS